MLYRHDPKTINMDNLKLLAMKIRGSEFVNKI